MSPTATATTRSPTSPTSPGRSSTTRSPATRANRLDGGPGDDTLDGGGPGGAGDPDLDFGGPGADACQSFGEISSCNDKSPPQQQTPVELNRGLDGNSLVITGLGDDSHIGITYGGGAFTVTDPTGVESREGSGCVP